MPEYAPERARFEYRQVEEVAWSGTATTCRENFDRAMAFSATVPIGVTQVMSSFGIPLYQGDVITKLAFQTGTTAAGTPTNWWFALYDPFGNLLSQTADQLTTAWAANTAKDLSLLTAQTITLSGLYYAAVMVKATTVPTMTGALWAAGSTNMAGGTVAGQGVKAQTSGSGLTTTAPATIASPALLNGLPYIVAH